MTPEHGLLLRPNSSRGGEGDNKRTLWEPHASAEHSLHLLHAFSVAILLDAIAADRQTAVILRVYLYPSATPHYLCV